MFCPEDGSHIGPVSAAGIYPPCPKCGKVWAYDGENGRYEVWDGSLAEKNAMVNEANEPPHIDPIVWDLEAIGRERRGLGAEKLVANLIDAMKATARRDGQCTYYTGTYAIARETIVNAGITCEKDPDWRSRVGPPAFDPQPVRWVAFFGDDFEFLSERRVIKHLLAERE